MLSRSSCRAGSCVLNVLAAAVMGSPSEEGGKREGSDEKKEGVASAPCRSSTGDATRPENGRQERVSLAAKNGPPLAPAAVQVRPRRAFLQGVDRRWSMCCSGVESRSPAKNSPGLPRGWVDKRRGRRTPMPARRVPKRSKAD